jgi:hypothetical protein
MKVFALGKNFFLRTGINRTWIDPVAIGKTAKRFVERGAPVFKARVVLALMRGEKREAELVSK